MSGDDLLEHLRAENARLIALLEAHGVEWRLPDEPPQPELRKGIFPLRESSCTKLLKDEDFSSANECETFLPQSEQRAKPQ